jgi:hypothetical protein
MESDTVFRTAIIQCSPLVDWYTGGSLALWRCRVSLRNADLTWRFELRLSNPDRWIPITNDMVGDRYARHVGTQEFPDIWDDAKDRAPTELEEVLADLTETGDPLGMTGARILVWEGIGTEGEPACILEATAEQLTAGRLELASHRVQMALREVEIARTQARVQVVKAASESRLSRNTIARLVSGALTRRLVLQLLSGYDLVEGIRDALPSWDNRYRRWSPDFVMEPDLDTQQYLGPFCYGPIQLYLDTNGLVHLSLVDRDGLHEPDIPLPDGTDEGDKAAEEAGRAYCQARAERARGYAKETLPLLREAGFTLRKPDGTTASADDLSQTINGPALLVSDNI